MNENSFCSRAVQAGDPVLPGTGVRAAVYVFLPVRKALWGDNELNDGWASAEQIAAIRLARKGGVVTRLYNPPAGEPGAASQVLVHARPGAPQIADVQALLAVMPSGWTVADEAGPLMAICTHGTRDRCCAKWGFSVYKEAARLYLEGLSAFRPVECSHLGGDRFAATGIVFPSGSMYAHLDRADLAALAAAEAKGGLVADHYRGRVFESELTQIVRAGLARDGRAVTATSAVALVNPQDAPGEVEVVAEGAGRFAVLIALAETRFYGSCEALAAGRASHVRRLVYAGARALAD